MKSKPVVMDHFFTVHTSFIVDFRFTNNITILTGDSGTGKTAAFSFIRECMAVNPNILCINYVDYQKDIGDMIRKAYGKLIVIDNADILLDDDTRKYISLDDKNQYLIIGRNPKNLFATKENVFPHDKVYDEGIAVGKSQGRLEAKKEFAFGLFGDGMSCEKIAKYINEPVDTVKQLEKEWKSQHDKRTI